MAHIIAHSEELSYVLFLIVREVMVLWGVVRVIVCGETFFDIIRGVKEWVAF
jgi:hypothetical protein